ncbi:ATP-dependent RecD-like DNA helicase [Bacillus coahuilensis]|uniref:SF1B family DNA helicase RecD2 n=1 Tax=Bacillus coahuilensis TaxID=408580 RepID=UPI0001850769|nr:ATP-dependent RecD-like DNA helicase [Bacillus coahuilensis]
MEEQRGLDLFKEDEPFVKGRLIVSIFHNESNLYSVIRIRVDETNTTYDEKEAVVTGYFPAIHEQETYTFFGGFQDHPKFGQQFKADRFQKDIPQTKQGVIHYLSSDLFKGVGKKTAESIVEVLGDNAISQILQNKSALEQVPKLSKDKAKEIYDTLKEHEGLEQILIKLNALGFGPQLSMKIYQQYKETTLDCIQKNPYQLVEDVEGVGFGRADELGVRLGITGSHPDRVKAGILYTIEQLCMQDGHVYADSEELLVKTKALLQKNQKESIEFSSIANCLVQLEEEGKLIGDREKRVFLPSLFFAEKGIVTNIQRLLSSTAFQDQFPESEFLLALGRLEERIGVEYASSQKEAIQTALGSPLMLLTGGPGTGKTTVINGIVELYSDLHGCSLNPKDYKDEPFPILLTAPTGRAAKRMTESTGLPATTIHRLLGWNGQETFEHDDESPIKGKLLIVDETSMLDAWLANQLLKALPDDIQVIFVGDEDQLPSVGPGQVLKDLLLSRVIPTVRLTDIYRQAEGSSIIELAHTIKNGKVPHSITQPQKDRSFISCKTGQIADVVEKVAANAKKKGYATRDIQVLAPMYKGPAGIDALNKALQGVLNPNTDGTRKELAFGETTYRIGDKVLQLVNQPESNVFNGDIGEVVSIFYAKENIEKQDMLLVSFDGVEVTYTKQDLNQITLAYCCSIHKSQGSEFPIVILPVVRSYYRMLRRNLLYTAITRSKNFLILVGEEDAFRQGIERVDDVKRRTTLMEKLMEVEHSENSARQVFEPSEIELTEGTIDQIDPMIGMENLTPYDFV